jgi:hypothetical protein
MPTLAVRDPSPLICISQLLIYIIMLCSELSDLNAGHRSVSEIMHLYIPYICSSSKNGLVHVTVRFKIHQVLNVNLNWSNIQ